MECMLQTRKQGHIKKTEYVLGLAVIMIHCKNEVSFDRQGS